jgi:hypothetical protein
LKGVLRGGVASEASWTAGTLEGSAIGALDSSDGGFRLAELDPRLSLPTSSLATTGSSAVCAGEFCSEDGEGPKLAGWQCRSCLSTRDGISLAGH